MKVDPPVILDVMSQALRIALGSAYTVQLAPGYSSSGEPWSINVYQAPNYKKYVGEVTYDVNEGQIILYSAKMFNFSISDPELVLKLVAAIRSVEPFDLEVDISSSLIGDV